MASERDVNDVERPFKCTKCDSTWSAAELLHIFFSSVRGVAGECLCGADVVVPRTESNAPEQRAKSTDERRWGHEDR